MGSPLFSTSTGPGKPIKGKVGGRTSEKKNEKRKKRKDSRETVETPEDPKNERNNIKRTTSQRRAKKGGKNSPETGTGRAFNRAPRKGL